MGRYHRPRETGAGEEARPSSGSRPAPNSVTRQHACRRSQQLMEIMQVMGTLVCTFRVAGLGHMHPRVLRNSQGKKLVAVPVPEHRR